MFWCRLCFKFLWMAVIVGGLQWLGQIPNHLRMQPGFVFTHTGFHIFVCMFRCVDFPLEITIYFIEESFGRFRRSWILHSTDNKETSLRLFIVHTQAPISSFGICDTWIGISGCEPPADCIRKLLNRSIMHVHRHICWDRVGRSAELITFSSITR